MQGLVQLHLGQLHLQLLDLDLVFGTSLGSVLVKSQLGDLQVDLGAADDALGLVSLGAQLLGFGQLPQQLSFGHLVVDIGIDFTDLPVHLEVNGMQRQGRDASTEPGLHR